MATDGIPPRGSGREIGERARRLLRAQFLLMLVILAGMSGVAFGVFHLLVRGEDQGALLFDISGRQRMLVQHIAVDALRLADLPAENRAGVRADLEASADALAEARHSIDAKMPWVAAASRGQEIGQLESRLRSELLQFDAAARSLLRAPDGELTRDHPDLRRIEAMAAGPLLDSTNQLVLLLSNGMRGRVHDLHVFAVGGEVLFLVLLGFTAWQLVRPMLRNTAAALAQLEGLENYHRSVVDALADGILVVDPDLRLVEAMNPAARAIFRLVDGREAGLPLAALMPATRGVPLSRLRRWYRHEIKGRTDNDEPFHLEVTVREAPVDGRDRLITVVRDVTRRVEAEEKAHTLNHAMEQSAASVLITDTEGVIRYTNPRACDITGYSRNELVGQTPSLFKSGLTPPEVYAELWGRLKAGETWKGELLNRRKSGEFYWESLVVSPLRDVHGAITHYLAVTEDVTERKQMEEALVVAKWQAERANRTKSDFLASMSHELRTPLNAIIGYAEFMTQEPFGSIGHGKYREYLGHIEESGRHLLKVINDLLDLSKVEAGKLALEEEEVDLGENIRSALHLVTEQATRRGVELSARVAPELPRLRADPLRIKQIVLNLLSNAIKFTGAGGKVTLTASLDPDGAAMIVVEDTGVGIAPENIAKALEPFGQIVNPMVSRQLGTGLGLPISKQLVELHGGALELASTLGVGTTVTIRLPAERVAPSQTG